MGFSIYPNTNLVMTDRGDGYLNIIFRYVLGDVIKKLRYEKDDIFFIGSSFYV